MMSLGIVVLLMIRTLRLIVSIRIVASITAILLVFRHTVKDLSHAHILLLLLEVLLGVLSGTHCIGFRGFGVAVCHYEIVLAIEAALIATSNHYHWLIVVFMGESSIMRRIHHHCVIIRCTEIMAGCVHRGRGSTCKDWSSNLVVVVFEVFISSTICVHVVWEVKSHCWWTRAFPIRGTIRWRIDLILLLITISLIRDIIGMSALWGLVRVHHLLIRTWELSHQGRVQEAVCNLGYIDLWISLVAMLSSVILRSLYHQISIWCLLERSS